MKSPKVFESHNKFRKIRTFAPKVRTSASEEPPSPKKVCIGHPPPANVFNVQLLIVR